ncbi:anaerobic ribonucleoside-triphosphate reductase activating protein [Clostridium sp. MD294]|uniref:anaerobic ribonucleoside-triphosphate reductase activating protein n=1 Tax=Clostridium sp. MD294 TaxID=97138 RepID=UPI0002C95350|nr:anaerobic ribonucleoside-triphosphate reductase activating protein [Clostridium sp. MD294]NDO47621.1 anaerobic ribonucleoside-triphosphate reductase activating protein [Clostridium sp. MD294]USF30061.1 Choline trimethylamine-lyase activating enzyme [Clostridium sp. MD294]
MNIRINGVVNDSIVDGESIRFTIFTQGCPHHCPHCHNPQTHDPNGGYEENTENLIAMIAQNPLLDGITLSGGEPMEQPLPCSILAQEAKKMGLTVWLYTGYTWEELLAKNDKAIQKLLHFTDVLIDGTFIYELRSLELYFKGSSNQRTIDVQKSLLQHSVVLWQKNIITF